MLVSSIDYNEFVGRIAIGRIERGSKAEPGDLRVQLPRPEAELRKAKATAIYEFDGLQRVPVTEVGAGNIIAMSGIRRRDHRRYHLRPSNVEALPFVKISKPPPWR
jgi:GTP-binding protein